MLLRCLPADTSSTSSVLFPSAATNSRPPFASTAKWSNRPLTPGSGIVLMSLSAAVACARAPMGNADKKINKTAAGVFIEFDCVLFISQRLNRIEPRGFPRGIKTEHDADGAGDGHRGGDGRQRQQRWPMQQPGDGHRHAAPA